ncbi:MAG: tyrosine-protein phosphatase [Candidatus Obscuribacterales bacterium]|nr:tyrosine-protein phosphatase [Candidatus Obscuribacterales bacterium]
MSYCLEQLPTEPYNHMPSIDKLKKELKNFHQVNDWLYRGAQPDASGFELIKEYGIKTVINFRWRKTPAAREKEQLSKIGMHFIHIPLNYWTLPAQKELYEFLDLLEQKELRPIFVHCLHGADRTGVMIAMFRILRCGYSLQAAYDEMVKCGFHRFSTRHFKWGLWRLAKLEIEKQSSQKQPES